MRQDLPLKTMYMQGAGKGSRLETLLESTFGRSDPCDVESMKKLLKAVRRQSDDVIKKCSTYINSGHPLIGFQENAAFSQLRFWKQIYPLDKAGHNELEVTTQEVTTRKSRWLLAWGSKFRVDYFPKERLYNRDFQVDIFYSLNSEEGI